MQLDLILSSVPSKAQLNQALKSFGLGECAYITNHDWQNIPTADFYIQIQSLNDKHWQCRLSVFCTSIDNEKIQESLLYFSMAKNIANTTLYDVVCCYFDNKIINDISYHPYLDFANDGHHGNIIIVRCIDKEMHHFLTHGTYWHTNSQNE